jgi:hypothetical protein
VTGFAAELFVRGARLGKEDSAHYRALETIARFIVTGDTNVAADVIPAGRGLISSMQRLARRQYGYDRQSDRGK